MTFKNANFTGRVFEMTNVVACEAPSVEVARAVNPHANWIPAPEFKITCPMTALWRQGGVTFFGFV